MPDLEGLAPPRAALLTAVQRLGTLRRCFAALRRGRRVPFAIAADVYGFVRDGADGRPAFVMLSRAEQSRNVPVNADVVELFAAPGTWVDVATGERFELGGTDTSVPVEPWTIRVLIPADDGCVP